MEDEEEEEEQVPINDNKEIWSVKNLENNGNDEDKKIEEVNVMEIDVKSEESNDDKDLGTIVVSLKSEATSN